MSKTIGLVTDHWLRRISLHESQKHNQLMSYNANEDANSRKQYTYCEASDPSQQHTTYCKQNNGNAFLHGGAACVHPTSTCE
jgi:hypothetical protein